MEKIDTTSSSTPLATVSSSTTPNLSIGNQQQVDQEEESTKKQKNVFERIVKTILSKIFMVDTIPLGMWLKMKAGDLIANLSFERKEKMGEKLAQAMIKAPKLLNESFEELKRRGFIQGGVSASELEAIKLKVLESRPDYIQHITDPSYEQIHKAVSTEPKTYMLVSQNKDLTETLLKSEKVQAGLIGYAKEKTQGLCEIAITKDVTVCAKLPKEAMSPEVCLFALTNNPESLHHIKAEYLQKATLDQAIEKNPEIGFLLSSTPELREKFGTSNEIIGQSPTAAQAVKQAASKGITQPRNKAQSIDPVGAKYFEMYN